MPSEVVKIETNVYDLYGDSPYDQIYSMTDGTRLQNVICTTNHKDFNQALTDMANGENIKSYLLKQLEKDNEPFCQKSRCQNCGVKFKHKPIGIPLRVDKTTIAVEPDKYKMITLFHCKGKFHNFRCALGYVVRKLATRYDQRDTRYIRAESDLQMMYTMMHPDGPFLKAAEDPDILDVNSGCVTEKEYDDGKYQYINTGNIVILPCKEEFARKMYKA
jgi:hypothetical protein